MATDFLNSKIARVLPVLQELRRAAADAQESVTWPDPADWRCSPRLNWIRVYGLLVSLAGFFKLQSLEASYRRSIDSDYWDEHTQRVFRLLSAFARLAEQHPSLDEVIQKAKRTLKDVLRWAAEVCPSVHGDGRGAYLGEEWRQPVPPTFQSMLSFMAHSPDARQRKEILQQVLLGPESYIAQKLEEANIGIASVAHLALTFDDHGSPRSPVDGDHCYRGAALIRVLAAHRVLLETTTVNDPAAMLCLISLAEEIATETSFTGFFSEKQADQAYLATTREAAISILQDPGCIVVGDAAQALRRRINDAEHDVVGAMDKVSRSAT